MSKWVKSVLAVGALVTMLIGAIEYFAKAEDLDQVAHRLDGKIRSDAILDVNRRVWQLQDRNSTRECREMRPGDKEECNLLKLKLELLKEDGK